MNLIVVTSQTLLSFLYFLITSRTETHMPYIGGYLCIWASLFEGLFFNGVIDRREDSLENFAFTAVIL